VLKNVPHIAESVMDVVSTVTNECMPNCSVTCWLALEMKQKPSYRKGKLNKRVAFVREVVREVVGFAPYEKRTMELMKVGKEKRALKLLKAKLGTHKRAKKDDVQSWPRPCPQNGRGRRLYKIKLAAARPPKCWQSS